MNKLLRGLTGNYWATKVASHVHYCMLFCSAFLSNLILLTNCFSWLTVIVNPYVCMPVLVTGGVKQFQACSQTIQMMYMTYAHCRSSFNNFCTYISTGLANCTKHNLDCMCMTDGYDIPRQLFFSSSVRNSY